MHDCPYCGMTCDCDGEDVWHSWPGNANCTHVCEEPDDEEYEIAPDQEWLCVCGHYQEDGLHCDSCGREPPWGCDCSACQDRDMEDDPDEWLHSWADYPGDLLAGSIEFDEMRDKE